MENKNHRAMLTGALLIGLCLAESSSANGAASGNSSVGTNKSETTYPTPFCLYKDQQPQRCGYVNKNGTALPQIWEGAYEFSRNGLAVVVKNKKYGYINKDGIVVIPIQYEAAYQFSDNGLAMFLSGRKFGFINSDGQVVIQPQFDTSSGFSNNLAMVVLNGKAGFIDKNGKFVIPPQYEGANDFAPNGLAAVVLNGKFGYINTRGEMVIAPKYLNAGAFDRNGLAQVFLPSREDKHINASGKITYFPYRHGDFSTNGLASTSNFPKKDGYINVKGEIVIPARYSSAGNFSDDGLASVRISDKSGYGYINRKGEMIIPPKYKSADDFSGGLARVLLPGEEVGFVRFINLKGGTVAYQDEVDGTLVLRNSKDNIIFPVQPSGNIQTACDHIYVGKQFEARGGRLSIRWTYEVVGFDKTNKQVTIRNIDLEEKYTQVVGCADIPTT